MTNVLTRIDSVISNWKVGQSYEANRLRYRVPMGVAILSVAFQEWPAWNTKGYAGFIDSYYAGHLFAAVLLVASLLALTKYLSRVAIALFLFVSIIAIVPDWTTIANHSFLALWCIVPALLFSEHWNSKEYLTYLRWTFGIVMLAAGAQKIMAGTYIDGSYLTYLSFTGSTTESLFSLFCAENPKEPCSTIQFISIFILLWQFVVGFLLLAGLNSIVFLMIEIGFLLGAGFYADEMNFQVLNIALLCILFKFGMPIWLLVSCLGFLVIDYFTISKIISWIF